MQTESSEPATFLFTTIHGDPQPLAMAQKEERLALAQHDRLLIETIEAENGQVFRQGAGVVRATFSEPANAVRAALKAQMSLHLLARSGGAYSLGARVRIALHSGTAERFERAYSGATVARTDALACAGNGGQILVSDATKSLVNDGLPYEATFRDLGSHGLPDTRLPIRIWQLCHPDLPNRFQEMNTLNLQATNIPIYAASFLGRKGDMARVRGLIRPGRPVTLVGEPGIGKTRLACEVGFAQLDAYPDGVWLIALEPVEEASTVADEVASQLGIRREPGVSAREAVTAHLRQRRLLLILDHGGGLGQACADLVGHLQIYCAGVAIVATGPDSLGVDGERAYYVPPMALPPAPAGPGMEPPAFALARYESIRLFLERARARRPDLEFSPALVASLCRLCLLVNGNALAIELAAAQAHSLSIEEMTEYIAASSAPTVADRPADLPAADPLCAMLDWSYAMLTVKEKILLLRLSVFAGGWEREDAEFVCADAAEAATAEPESRIAPADVAPLLGALVDRALVQRIEAQPSHRYYLPQVVRQYCLARRQRLREDSLIRARHCRYFFRLAHDATALTASPDRTAAQERLARSQHNLRAALQQAVVEASRPAISVRSGAVERLLLFSAAAVSLSSGRGPCDSYRKYIDAALAAPGANEPTGPRAGALLAAAKIASAHGSREQAIAYVEEAVGIFRALNDFAAMVRSLEQLAVFAEEAGNHAAASRHRHAAHAVERAHDTVHIAAVAPDDAGAAELAHGASATAMDPVGEPPAGRRQASHERAFAEALDALGRAALDRADLDAAHGFLSESLDLWRRLQDARRTASALERMAMLACMENKPQWGASLYLAACRLREEDDMPLAEVEQEDLRETVGWIRRHIDAAVFDQAERKDLDAGIDHLLAGAFEPVLRVVEGGKTDGPAVPIFKAANAKP